MPIIHAALDLVLDSRSSAPVHHTSLLSIYRLLEPLEMRERDINKCRCVAALVFYTKCLNVGGQTVYGRLQTSESCRESELPEDQQSPYGR
jgi:hypothetical protein